MGKIIAISNQKGGVGKTTTSINLAAGLSYCGKKVLLVDFDPQGNASHGISHGITAYRYSVYDVLMNDENIKEAKIALQMPPLDLLPSAIELASVDIEMANYKIGREAMLRRKLEAVKEDYDFIIIDCPPSLGLLNINALTAADSVLIPVQCEYFSLEGITQLLNTIRFVQRTFNDKLKIEGVLLTMHDARTKLSVEVQQEIRKNFKEITYKTIIPRNVKLSESPGNSLSIFDYDVKSEGAKAYASLVAEVLERNQKGARHGK